MKRKATIFKKDPKAYLAYLNYLYNAETSIFSKSLSELSQEEREKMVIGTLKQHRAFDELFKMDVYELYDLYKPLRIEAQNRELYSDKEGRALLVLSELLDEIAKYRFKEKTKELEKREAEIQAREKALKKKEKPGSFKRAGHLTDQILKYNYPKDHSGQLPIFNSLTDKTQSDIKEGGIVEVEEVVEGIRLSPSETKVIDCLCKLLHERSQNSDPKNEDYYSGNKPYDLIEYGGGKTPAPNLAFTLYELTKEYKGEEYVGGKDIENVKQILTELDNKRFLLSYKETTKKKDGGRIESKIEEFRKLVHIAQISQTEYSKDGIELSKTQETIVVLSPIFRRQIDSKFILYPNDINRRTIIAYGSQNLSDIALRLRDYLLRELSYKHYEPEIGLERLYYLVAEKWMKESRKKKVKEYTDKALETVKALGLLLSYEVKPGATGELKVVFNLNKEWR